MYLMKIKNEKLISLYGHTLFGKVKCSINTFKHRLDKIWLNQEVIYNYKADVVGTGNRSIIN